MGMSSIVRSSRIVLVEHIGLTSSAQTYQDVVACRLDAYVSSYQLHLRDKLLLPEYDFLQDILLHET